MRIKTSKSGHGRVLPLAGQLMDLIEKRWQAREVMIGTGNTFLSPFVFHRSGKQVGSFRRPWIKACKKAGYPGKLFHDLRRTSIRNMTRAGVPHSVAMTISGHKTIHTFLRYNISSQEDQKKALLATQDHVESQVVEQDNLAVLPLKK